MTTATGRTRCVTCGKEKATLKCGGCSQNFCFDHVASHRQELSRELDEVEFNRDIFRQTLMEQTVKLQKHPLIQQIDEWERASINKIQQTAEEARQMLFQHTTEHIKQVEAKLNKLTDELREKREDNDFFEIDLYRWKEELTQLVEQLDKPSNIHLRHDSTPLITKISIDVLNEVPSYFLNIATNARWSQNGITVVGGNGRGNELNQLSNPMGICIDDNQTIYIADYYNHRIVEWKSSVKTSKVVVGGNGEGNQPGQLNCPTDVIIHRQTDCLIICDHGNRRVIQLPRRSITSGQTIIANIDCYGLAIDSDGYIYITDYKNHEVRRWRIGDTSGILVAGGNGQGNNLNQLDFPTNVFVDQDHSVFVSDQMNHRVMKWMKGAKQGIVVAGNRGEGSDLTQLSYPYTVIVDQIGTAYIADSNRIMRWTKGTTEGSVVVGRNGQGTQSNQLHFTAGMSFDRQGNLYVVDVGNDRVQKFNIV